MPIKIEKFTDRFVANMKPPAKRTVYVEPNAYGHGTLGLRVSPAGTKSWIFTYYQDGRVRVMTLGRYPKVTVAGAHAELGRAIEALQHGHDPASKTVAANKRRRSAPRVADLIDGYLEMWAKPRKRSWKEDQRMLNVDVRPMLGDKRAEAVARRDVVALLDGILERGAPIAANRTLAVVRKMFNWAISRDLMQHNPCLGIAAPAPARRRERVLTMTEVRTFLDVLPTTRMSRQSQLALQLLLVTAQRCGEVLSAEWSEFDLAGRWWTIPGSKAKNGRAHRVPLSDAALDVLATAREINAGATYVFASPRGDKPMVETAVARALRRNAGLFDVPHFTPHDLRRTAASHMTSLGHSRLVVSKILNHTDSSVTALYDRYSYDPEKRSALAGWADTISTSVPHH